MFTGIVEEVGVVSSINRTRTGIALKIKTGNIYQDAGLGYSVAVNGVCLSVTDIKGHILNFDVVQETIKRTTLAGLKVNDSVNLESSLRTDSRIGGHFVSGHIDYKAALECVLNGPDGIGFKLSLPDRFSRFVARKGSIALDGVSLTVADVSGESFTVYLIPHTLEVTTLGKKKKGDELNVETDLLAKYLARHIEKPALQDLLKKYNYI